MCIRARVSYWRPTEPLPTDFTFFAQVVGADTTRYAAIDAAPPMPTSGWTPGEVYEVRLPLALDPATPGDAYPLIVGLYTRTAEGGFDRLQPVSYTHLDVYKRQSPGRVSAHLAAADLMVMPYRDGVSLRRGTLMAVLAHGRPLVTTAPATPTPELRHGENVWLVRPDDATTLAGAITALAADPTRRGQLGRGAREVAGLFDWGRIAGLTADFYAAVIAGGG